MNFNIEIISLNYYPENLQVNFHGWKISIEMMVRLQQALVSGDSSLQTKVPGETIDLIALARQAFSEAVELVGDKTFPQLHIRAVEVVEKAKTKTTETVPLTYPQQHIW